MPHNITGKIVETPGESKPYRVVFKDEGEILTQVDARNNEEAEAVLKAVAAVLRQLADRRAPRS